MSLLEKVYSEYAITNMAIQFVGEQSASPFGCVGSLEESLGVKALTKKCEGVVVKNITKPDGTGSLKVTAHVNYSVFLTAYGFTNDTLKKGVQGYGKLPHKEFTLAAIVLDEDDNVKYKAYPKCVVSAGVARKIENGGDEVAEIELEISLARDENGFVFYEMLDGDDIDQEVKTKWLTQFTPDLVKKEEVIA